MKNLKKVISVLLVAVVVICMGEASDMKRVSAAPSTITGNNTKALAHNYGSWQSINWNNKTAVLEKRDTQSWFAFTVEPGERIYLRCSSDEECVGVSAVVKDGLGNNVSSIKRNSEDLIGKKYMQALYLECDNTSTETKTYYLVVDRENYDLEQGIYFNVTAYERIKKGHITFNFDGKVVNNGNVRNNLNGIDSTELSLDLTNEDKIPKNAIVKEVSTNGYQSPAQVGVHHMIMPKGKGQWYTAIAASNTNGFYSIKTSDNISAKQIWYFKYNALASAKSTMNRVTLTMDFEYDLQDTNYEPIKR